MRAAMMALLLLTGCRTTLSSGFGVALSIVADSSISDAALANITRIDLSVSGDETESAHYDFSRRAFPMRKETVVYRPLAASRTIAIAITAFDADGNPVGAGSTVSIALSADQLTAAQATLSTPGLADLAMMMPSDGAPPVDLGAVDLTTVPVDLAQAAPPDLRGVDLAGCASSVEDCFNGVDDDCNGLVDCADPACNPTAECVPAGMALPQGTTTDVGMTCPTSFTAFAVTLNQGIHQGTSCNGCSCTGKMLCHSNIYDYGASACPGATVSGIMFQTDNTYCQGNGAVGINYTSGKIKADAFTATPSCAASGSPTVPALTWDRRTQFCQTNIQGGGCASGGICVPKIAKHCVLATGNVACPSGYTPEGAGGGTPWNSGSTEGRTCAACTSTCGAASGGGCPTSISFYSSQNCTGVGASVAAGTSNCSAGGPYQSATVLGATAPTCGGSSTSAVQGAATETGTQTLCCR
jgi:hypothetical protein